MKILVIVGHPAKESFNKAMAINYVEEAERNGHEVDIIHLSELEINLNMTGRDVDIEPEFVAATQQKISHAEHIAWFFPVWWADVPAKLKAFFDLVFASGFAFKYLESKRYVKWDKLLKDKSALMVATMDGPPWYYKYFVGEPVFKMLRYNLKFCGFKKVKRKYFGSVKTSTHEQRTKWLEQVKNLAV